MTTLLLHHPAFLDHLTPIGHPERPDRLRALHQALDNADFAALQRVEAPLGEPGTALLAHPERYVETIRKAVPAEGLTRIDADTVASPGSWEAALRAIGAASAAIDAVVAGEANNAFAALRPPGHHAETARAMGFCLFNTVAIAARYAQKTHGLQRVAIVDWDVHHGNGTQEIFWTDPSVLYASTHQMPLFPGTGALRETGAGNIWNAPLAPGDGSERFRSAFRERILPALRDFRPDLVIISAGFDAHVRDPLASMQVSTNGFRQLMRVTKQWAGHLCDNRLVCLLEGGYDLTALGDSVAAVIEELLSDEYCR